MSLRPDGGSRWLKATSPPTARSQGRGPEGADIRRHRARVDSEDDCARAVGKRDLRPANVLVIRHEGRAEAGMREMLGVTALIQASRWARRSRC